MNRRELFQGLGAALFTAGLPIQIPVMEEQYGRSPAQDALLDQQMLNYLQKVRLELIQKIVNPPLVLDGHFVRPLSVEHHEEALLYITRCIDEIRN